MEELIVLHEDNHILVVLKSQGEGMTGTGKDGDLITRAQQYLAEKKGKDTKSFCVPVYTIDKPVGGVAVFAKSAKALNRLNQQLADGELERVYYAITSGVPKQPTDHVVNYVKQTNDKFGLELIPQLTTGAVRAELSYSMCDKRDNLALLKVMCSDVLPKQARFMLARLGFSVHGDATFGKPAKSAKLALWLTDVRLIHPVTERIMTFRINPPADSATWDKFNIQLLLKVI